MDLETPIFLRAYVDPASVRIPKSTKLGREQNRREEKVEVKANKKKASEEHPPKWPDLVLVLDTECTTDSEQNLAFGISCICVDEGGVYVPRRRTNQFHAWTVFHADNLDERSLGILRKYAQEHGLNGPIPLRRFIRNYFWWAIKNGAMVVGFNLPFDLTRIHSDARWDPKKERWMLIPYHYKDKKTGEIKEGKHRPRVYIKPLDKVDVISSGGCMVEYLRGRFLDLAVLVEGLSSRSHSLASGCDAYGVKPGKMDYEPTGKATEEIAYCKADIEATVGLLNVLRRDFDRHPINLRPDETFSTAAIAKAYLKAMGIASPKEKFKLLPPEMLGIAAEAFHGSRAETNIRRQEVPVVAVDVVSEYPTVWSLMGLGSILTAANLRIEGSTGTHPGLLDETRKLLSEAAENPSKYLDPTTWPNLNFFALAEPGGSVLPFKARFDGQGISATVAPLKSLRPIWFAGPALIAAAIKSGKAPKIIRVIRLVPEGEQEGLKSIKLPNGAELRPRTFAKQAIEERMRLKKAGFKTQADFLKIAINSATSGIYAETTIKNVGWDSDEKRPGVATSTIYYGITRRKSRTPFVESAGEFQFWPLASLVTAGGQLFLALIERMVADAKGTIVMMDTDAASIVSTRDGGLIALKGGAHRLPNGKEAVLALPWGQVKQAIIDKFGRLNPYDPALVPEILKPIDENFEDSNPEKLQRQLYVFSVSTKRYAHRAKMPDGTIEVVKLSGHGLDIWTDPTPDWDEKLKCKVHLREAWQWIIEEAQRMNPKEPAWFDQVLTRDVSFSTYEIQKILQESEKNLPYLKRKAKPYSFCLAALEDSLFREPRILIAPFTNNRSSLRSRTWIDAKTGEKKMIITDKEIEHDDFFVQVLIYGDYIRKFALHPEGKALDINGKPCDIDTAGFLKPIRVTASDWIPTPKDHNRKLGREDNFDVFRGSKSLAFNVIDPAQKNNLKNESILRLRKKYKELIKSRVTNRQVCEISGLGRRTIQRFINNPNGQVSAETFRGLNKVLKALSQSRNQIAIHKQVEEARCVAVES